VSEETYERLEQGLKELYSEVPAPPTGLVGGRDRMLAEAVQLRARPGRAPLSAPGTRERLRTITIGRRKMSMMLAYKVLAAVMAVVVAVAGMGGSVVLAADSLPGELLYPVKLVSEDVSLALTLDPASRAELALDFASERVQEMERLLQRGEDVPEAVVARLTRQMEQVMVEIARSRPEEVPALLERVTERAQMHQQTLEDAATGVGEETQDRLREASRVMERACQSAENDPLYLEHQYEERYEGTPGPHGQASPAAAGAGQQEQEQSQQQYEGTPGPHGQASPEPAGDPQRNQEEYERQYEGTPGPHREGSPAATASFSPTATVTPAQERVREERHEPDSGDSDPVDDGHGSSTDMPEQTTDPRGSDKPGGGH
jgi:hypothetical protein